ncbi:hypothetical protein RHMOL_Rhmol04G0117000 [Rhododendron molle]|uniref:Uncharacterized protein n=1 Tax=Rhododendron molle TaxID=49168 RepID=A0ACC0P1U1_RHOML|nr:hypothetical protein RHMOL_Rhmol04G0117000 [Rhododendron molle]
MLPSQRHRFIPIGISNRYELVRNIQEQISEVFGRRAIGLARTEIERLQVQVSNRLSTFGSQTEPVSKFGETEWEMCFYESYGKLLVFKNIVSEGKKVKKLYLALAAAPLPVGVMIYCVSIWLDFDGLLIMISGGVGLTTLRMYLKGTRVRKAGGDEKT